MSKLEEIKARLSKVESLPWVRSEKYSHDYYYEGYSIGTVADCIQHEGNANLIANAPSDIRYLLHILELLEQDLTYMKQHGELTNIDGKMKVCIDHALLTIHREE
jgi:hypothetical protein